jgi:hypothetical protein
MSYNLNACFMEFSWLLSRATATIVTVSEASDSHQCSVAATFYIPLSAMKTYAESLLAPLLIFLFPILILLSGVGKSCLSSFDKDSAIVFTTGRLPDVNPL